MKKVLLLTLLIAIIGSGCKKDSTPAKTNIKDTKGYDHTTPQGKLLNNLAQGSNKKLTAETVTYFNANGDQIGNFNETITSNIYLLFGDGVTVNPNYIAVAESSDGSPVLNNTGSEVHIDSSVDYLYYNPNQTTATILPVVKVKFTLSTDLKTLTLYFKDTTAGSAYEISVNKTISYSSRTTVYTFVGL